MQVASTNIWNDTQWFYFVGTLANLLFLGLLKNKLLKDYELIA